LLKKSVKSRLEEIKINKNYKNISNKEFIIDINSNTQKVKINLVSKYQIDIHQSENLNSKTLNYLSANPLNSQTNLMKKRKN